MVNQARQQLDVDMNEVLARTELRANLAAFRALAATATDKAEALEMALVLLDAFDCYLDGVEAATDETRGMLARTIARTNRMVRK